MDTVVLLPHLAPLSAPLNTCEAVPQHQHTASYKFANSQLCSIASSERMATLLDTRVHNVHDDVIRREVPPPNLNSPIFFMLGLGPNHQI